MSFKKTLILAIILLLLGGYVVYLRVNQTGEETAERPDVWSFQEESIKHIRIALPKEEKEIAFTVVGRDSWFIEADENKPVDLQRWGGIVLLLTGPQSSRVIANKVETLDLYGLDSPSMVITLGIQGQNPPQNVIVGDHTPDEKAVYVILQEQQTVYLLDVSWFDVLVRLVRQPPEKIIRPSIEVI